MKYDLYYFQSGFTSLTLCLWRLRWSVALSLIWTYKYISCRTDSPGTSPHHQHIGQSIIWYRYSGISTFNIIFNSGCQTLSLSWWRPSVTRTAVGSPVFVTRARSINVSLTSSLTAAPALGASQTTRSTRTILKIISTSEVLIGGLSLAWAVFMLSDRLWFLWSHKTDTEEKLQCKIDKILPF